MVWLPLCRLRANLPTCGYPSEITEVVVDTPQELETDLTGWCFSRFA